MGADRTMKRSARFATAILLAGMAQVSVLGAVSAQGLPWRFSSEIDPLTDRAIALASTLNEAREFISFACTRGKPASRLSVSVHQEKFKPPSADQINIAWRVDKGEVRHELWHWDKIGDVGRAVEFTGQSAYEFALAVMRARERVVFRTPGGTSVYDAKGSTKAISQMLEFCGLKK